MGLDLSFGKMESGAAFRGQGDPEGPFRVAVLGDFSGRSSRGVFADSDEIAGMKLFRFLPHEIDEALEELEVTIQIPLLGGAQEELTFEEMEEFHPDRLFKEVELFDELFALHDRLQGGNSDWQDRVRSWREEHSEFPPLLQSRGDWIPAAQEWEELASYEAKPALDPDADEVGLSTLMARAIGPFVPPDADDEALVTACSLGIQQLIRQVLHHPDFASVEAAWRSIDWLTRRIIKAEKVEVIAIDLSAAEFAADLARHESLEETGVYKLLVEKAVNSVDGQPWAMLVSAYQFDTFPAHAALLGRMAKIAQSVNAPFLAGMHPRVLASGFEWEGEVGEAWDQLRELPESAYLGLVSPRFLIRPSYGENFEPSELFSFEECQSSDLSRSFLWASGSFACAALLGMQYANSRWDFKPNGLKHLAEMPQTVYRNEEDELVGLSVEQRITTKQAKETSALGFMPILGVRGEQAIELSTIGSLSEKQPGLEGKWESENEPLEDDSFDSNDDDDSSSDMDLDDDDDDSSSDMDLDTDDDDDSSDDDFNFDSDDDDDSSSDLDMDLGTDDDDDASDDDFNFDSDDDDDADSDDDSGSDFDLDVGSSDDGDDSEDGSSDSFSFDDDDDDLSSSDDDSDDDFSFDSDDEDDSDSSDDDFSFDSDDDDEDDEPEEPKESYEDLVKRYSQNPEVEAGLAHRMAYSDTHDDDDDFGDDDDDDEEKDLKTLKKKYLKDSEVDEGLAHRMAHSDLNDDDDDDDFGFGFDDDDDDDDDEDKEEEEKPKPSMKQLVRDYTKDREIDDGLAHRLAWSDLHADEDDDDDDFGFGDDDDEDDDAEEKPKPSMKQLVRDYSKDKEVDEGLAHRMAHSDLNDDDDDDDFSFDDDDDEDEEETPDIKTLAKKYAKNPEVDDGLARRMAFREITPEDEYDSDDEEEKEYDKLVARYSKRSEIDSGLAHRMAYSDLNSDDDDDDFGFGDDDDDDFSFGDDDDDDDDPFSFGDDDDDDGSDDDFNFDTDDDDDDSSDDDFNFDTDDDDDDDDESDSDLNLDLDSSSDEEDDESDDDFNFDTDDDDEESDDSDESDDDFSFDSDDEDDEVSNEEDSDEDLAASSDFDLDTDDADDDDDSFETSDDDLGQEDEESEIMASDASDSADLGDDYQPYEGGSDPILDFNTLLKPIPGEDPSGDMIPFDVRENLDEMRKEVNPELYDADDPRRPKEPKKADWEGIETLCIETLTETTKDLNIVVRLMEALTKAHGFAGLRDGFHLSRLLFEKCWDRLRPEMEDEEEDLDMRSGPYNWLDDESKGALFPITIHSVPVLMLPDGTTYSWQDWRNGQEGKGHVSSEEFEQAVFNTPRQYLKNNIADATNAVKELQLLKTVMEAKLMYEAPGFTALGPALNDCRGLLLQIEQKLGPDEEEEAAEAGGTEMQPMSEQGVGMPAQMLSPAQAASVIQRQQVGATREDIYNQLHKAATALQKLEPHSPIPYLLLKAVELGRMPFPKLMKRLIRDGSVIEEMWREIGIQDDDDEDDD
ncbi:Hypothetical protein PBC10988_36630 [Planctomycetales bacterium 10988]|nr:Hypothetical protein PBC10988_36630 [Planctomycetales bacterium 10988]